MLSLMPDLAWLGLLLAPLLGMAADDAPRGLSPMVGPIDDPDRELVLAVLEGDATAYRGLVERYQSRIHSIVYGIVRNPEDARDLTQDAFVKAYQNLSSFRLEASFYTWLCRIAKNVSIDHLRRMKLRSHGEYDDGIASRDSGGVISLSHHRHDPGRDLERKELQEAIVAALDELPEEQRLVVTLREVQGLSYKEIAEVMDIPEGTVMSRLFYARKKLQQTLKGLRR